MPVIFEIIEGGLNKKIEAYNRYSDAADRAAYNFDLNPSRDNLKKFCFLATKCIVTYVEPKKIDTDLALCLLDRYFLADKYLSSLTPREFMQLFPITKIYDGKKCDLIDYFEVKSYIDTLELDIPINLQIDSTWDLIVNYLNDDINKLFFTIIKLLSYIEMHNGKETTLEKILNEINKKK